MARKDVQRGEFLTADGGKAEFGKDTGIRRGTFMTSTPVTRSNKNLQREFPEMAGAIEAAGPPLTTQQLAEHWRRQYELEQRLEDLKARIKSVKRK